MKTKISTVTSEKKIIVIRTFEKIEVSPSYMQKQAKIAPIREQYTY